MFEGAMFDGETFGAAEKSAKRLIILDRDGVINRRIDGYIRRPEEWEPIEGSIEAMVDLYRRGYHIVIATNQAGIGRGLMTVDDLIKVHEKLSAALGVYRAQVDALFFCPHAPDARCKCRKPQPGLLNSIARRYRSAIDGTFFVGDSLSDVEAAQAAGAKPMMVRTGRGATEAERAPAAVPVYDNLAAAVNAILGKKGRPSKKRTKKAQKPRRRAT